jgi:hypothetical protein
MVQKAMKFMTGNKTFITHQHGEQNEKNWEKKILFYIFNAVEFF